jgi:hypothetical protein
MSSSDKKSDGVISRCRLFRIFFDEPIESCRCVRLFFFAGKEISFGLPSDLVGPSAELSDENSGPNRFSLTKDFV